MFYSVHLRQNGCMHNHHIILPKVSFFWDICKDMSSNGFPDKKTGHWLADLSGLPIRATKRTISWLDTSAKLSISLRLREVVQILVREVLNWQVKPWENIRSFLNTCHFKSLFTFTLYFRSHSSLYCILFDLVLSTAADITGRAHQSALT